MQTTRFLGTSALVALIVPLLCAASSAEPETDSSTPAGPRLGFVKWGKGVGGAALETAGPLGGKRQRIVGPSAGNTVIPEWGFAPSWSADGGLVAFGGKVGGRKQRLFVARGDGTGLRAIPGTENGFKPVLSPDGRTVAFARLRSRVRFRNRLPFVTSYDSTTTWAVEVDGSRLRRLTPWRNGLEITPSSFSPDGSVIAASRRDEELGVRDDAIALSAGAGPATVIARNAYQPSFSPDGSRIAVIAYVERNANAHGKAAFFRGELQIVPVEGGPARRLARTTYGEQSPPSWDPSGERLAFARDGSVMAINADGSCPQKILARRPLVRFGGPAWQPGPGREAGRIPC